MSNYNCLDLNIIKEKIVEFASIEEAKSFLLKEEVDFNPLIIKKNSLQTKEALFLIKKEINVHFAGIENVNELFDKANKNITLSGIELKNVLVFHNHCARIKKQFDSFDIELSIKDYTDSLNINNKVFDEIDKCIENNGDIKSDATDLLKSLNKQIDSLEKDIYNRAQQFINTHTSSLQEQTIFTRENRVTFLIKNSDKNKFSGYAYGTSSSGLASYVEPGAFVELNNKMLDLLQAKVDEENRILRDLTYLVSSISSDYARNFDSLVKLNVIFAKASYGYKYNGIIANFVDGDYFEFNDLCHPLIEQDKVISNTYRLFEPYRGIVISGSNTGGKTVSLKAIGLSILMSYLGIPIIASDAKVPFYKNIFVDIDDNQSIQDSLSTFSAHITNINNILNNASSNSLILIDELISGTDPKEAQAISLAILDKIKELNSIFVITTHFDDIKNYSYNDESILLSAVGFDMNTLKPTYKYLEDSIGSSNAIDIATRYFDDQKIIENAKNYINKSKTKQDELLDKLAQSINENQIEKEKLHNLENELTLLKDKYNADIESFNNEKTLLKQKYLSELNEYIDSIKEKALIKLDSISDKKDNKVIKEIEELYVDKTIDEEVVFEIGDNVRINDNEQIGIINSIENDYASINLRGITVKAKLTDLKKMPKVVKKDKTYTPRTYKNVPKEINLVGQRVEDGLVLFEEYLDRANGANLSSVKIIHGIGTGALRSAIRERLKKLSYVDKFHDGDFYDGGSAVTIVEFKK